MNFLELLEVISINTKLTIKQVTEDGMKTIYTTAQSIYASMKQNIHEGLQDAEVINISHTAEGITLLLE